MRMPRDTQRRLAGAAATIAALAALLGGAGAWAQGAAGAAVAGTWLDAEVAVLGEGASTLWTAGDFAGTDVGGVRAPHGPGGGGTGRKVKAGLLSLLLPGAGQYYNGDRAKAWAFAGVEAAVWASYLTFDVQGDNRTDTYVEYAGIYAGVPGDDHDESYWRAVGRYLDSDAYNEAVRREARAFGTDPTGLVGPDAGWQWRNEDHLRIYQDLRADAARSYDRRDFMTLFAILNRVVSVYDAVRNSVDDKLQGEVLGFHVEMDVSPSLRNPRTGCTFTRRF